MTDAEILLFTSYIVEDIITDVFTGKRTPQEIVNQLYYMFYDSISKEDARNYYNARIYSYAEEYPQLNEDLGYFIVPTGNEVGV